MMKALLSHSAGKRVKPLVRSITKAQRATKQTSKEVRDASQSSQLVTLTQLPVRELKDIAVSVGAAVSGKKATIVQAIEESVRDVDRFLFPTTATADDDDAANEAERRDSSGTGGEISKAREELADDLAEIKRVQVLNGGMSREGGDDGGALSTESRIVSIDMGIRNLAFACLTVPKGWGASDLKKLEMEYHFELGLNPQPPEPTMTALLPSLTAWKRFAVFPSAATDAESNLTSASANASNVSSPSSSSTSLSSSSSSSSSSSPFAPAVLASHALTFANTIISTYKPTHILIERQRFRSSGSSAVLEWSLRVGMFESMLHACFRTLVQERGLTVQRKALDSGRMDHRFGTARASDGVNVVRPVSILSVDPGRVVRYCEAIHGADASISEPSTAAAMKSSQGKEAAGGRRQRKDTSKQRDVKKYKIDLVRDVLERSQRLKSSSPPSSPPSPTFSSTSPILLQLSTTNTMTTSSTSTTTTTTTPPTPEARSLAHTIQSFFPSPTQSKHHISSICRDDHRDDEYDDDDESATTTTTTSGESAPPPAKTLPSPPPTTTTTTTTTTKRRQRKERPPKLDDLADSLLTALTWLAWQRNAAHLRKRMKTDK